MLKIPRQVFSFTDWMKQRPREPIPGDRIDLQFQELISAIAATQRAIADIRADDGKLKRGVVTDDNLSLRIRDEAIAGIRDEIEPIRSSVKSTFTSTVASEHQAELYARDAEAAAAVAAQLTSGMDAIRRQAVAAADDAARDASITGSDATDAENWGNYALAQADNAELAANLSLQWAEYLAGPVVDSAHAPAYIAGSPFPYGLYYQPVEGGVAGLWSAKWWALWAQQLVGKGAFYYLGGAAAPPTPGGKNPNTGQPYPDPIAPGSLYYNTVSNTLYVWNGQDWVRQQQLTAGVVGTYLYYATAGQTAFSGPDANGQTPNVGVSPSIVHVNGDRLTSAQFTVNSTTSTLTVASAPAAGSPVIWDLLLPSLSLLPGAVNIFKVISFSPDGTVTDFPIQYYDPFSGAPTNALVSSNAELVVVLDGVEQEPGSDYTTSNDGTASVLHMVVPPAADSDFWAEWYKPGGAGGVPGPPGPVGPQGPMGPSGPTGATGQGVPAGGGTGQVLQKNSGTDYDTSWAALAGGIGININTLTSSPLLTDGVTSNVSRFQSLAPVLGKLCPEMPVQVTLTIGSPTVVTLNTAAGASGGTLTDNTHWLKPNQGFYFTVSAGGSLPTGITAGVMYYVMAANLLAKTFTFSATNNYNQTVGEGAAVNTSGTSSGTISIVLTGRDINIVIPSGPYYCGNYGDAAPTVNLTPNGISRIKYWAYGAIFDYKLTFGPHPVLFMSDAKAWTYQVYDLIKTGPNSYQSNSPLTQVTLITVANAANYYVGQWISVFGLDLQNPLGTYASNPPNNQYHEYKRITAINTSTGVLTLDGPLKWAYLSSFPNLYNSTGKIGGGSALIVPMHPCWDTEVEVHGARWIGQPTESPARRVKYIDCVFQGYGNAPSTGLSPSSCHSLIYRNCVFGPAGGAASQQVDKMMEYLEYDGCWGPNNWAINFISPSLQTCLVKNHIGFQIKGTPRQVRIVDSQLQSFLVGPYLGVTDACQINNSRVVWFDMASRQDDAATIAPNNDMTLVANWTFSNGTFTRNITGLPGNQPMAWQIPGAKIYFTDASLNTTPAAGWLQNMGAPFTILNVYMDGSGNFSFDTTLAAVPARQTSAAATITIASPGVVTGPTLANGTPVCFTTTGALPAGLTISKVYFVVNTSGTTFQVSATSGGAAINTSGTQSGVHTVYANPLCFRPHPCPRMTCSNNAGSIALMDLNGAIDEPLFSRVKRLFAGKQYNSATPAAFQQPNARIWGNLISMTVTVLRAGTAGTLQITGPGFTQPNLANSTFSQTIDLTQAGKRVVTNTAVTGNLGTDALAAYADWVAGPLVFIWAGTSGTYQSTALVLFEMYTDQGQTRFTEMFGAPASPAASTFVWQWSDSGIIQQYGTTP